MSVNTWQPGSAVALNITDAALAHIKKQLTKQTDKTAVRIGVKKSGCSGFKYDLDFVESAQAGDQAIDVDGVQVLVSADAAQYLPGTCLDFDKEGLNSSLKFINPQAKDVCGCGESFRA